MCLSRIPRRAFAIDPVSLTIKREPLLRWCPRATHPAAARVARSRPGRHRSAGYRHAGFTILGALLVLGFATAGLTLLQVRASVRDRLHRQIRLDRDTGAAVIAIRASLRTLSASYQRMEYYRGITWAACPVVPTPLCPAAKAAFQVAGAIEGTLQRMVEARWKANQLLWQSGGFIRTGYPDFDFPIATGGERDLYRLWMIDFNSRARKEMALRAGDGRLASTAELRRSPHDWQIAWTE
jgi:hypothetical protein